MWVSKSTPEFVMTEIERLEFNRRIDVANAVVKDAIRVFNQLTELDILIANKSNTTNIYWYLIVIFGGIAADYFLSSDARRIYWGEYIAWLAIFVWCWSFVEILYLKSRREHCSERLHELDVIWSGSTGLLTFWSLGGFAKMLEHDRENDKFNDWWQEQSKMILERVQVR